MSEQANTYREGSPYTISSDAVEADTVTASQLLEVLGVNVEDSTNNIVVYDSATQEVTADVNATNVAASNGLIDVYEDFTPQTAAPTHAAGRIALADGTNWDPDADSSAEIVISNGTSWVEIADLGTTL